MTRLIRHGKLEAGQVVKIKGIMGTFVVQWIDDFEDVDRPKEVTVVGGMSGHKAWRTFTEDRVKVLPKKRKEAE